MNNGSSSAVQKCSNKYRPSFAQAVALGLAEMYTVKLNGAVIAHTDWPPLAQAAWNRASRDRDSAQHGGVVELWVDNRRVASEKPQTLRGHPWPVQDAPDCDLRDVLKAFLQLMRDDGWDAKQIAEAMTHGGLPTTRARIDALRGSTPGKRTDVCAAELVVMMGSILTQYKKPGRQSDASGSDPA